MVFKKALIPAIKKTKGVIMSYDLMENNKVYLRGTITKEPEFSHEVFGEGFYELEMAVQRLSDHNDMIPITLSERLLDPKVFAVGNEVTVSGQFRSYNKVVDDKSRLMLTVFVREVLENDFVNLNHDAILPFRNLVLIAVKQYCFNRLVLRADKFYSTAGAELSRIKEIVDKWDDLEQNYEEQLMEFNGAAVTLDPESTYSLIYDAV